MTSNIPLISIIALGLLLSANKGVAQITITQADMPYAGLTVSTDSDLAPTVGPGNKGPSQTWNFTTLNPTKAQQINFMAPSSTPYAASFPSANLADSTLGFAGYNFFSSQAPSFAVVGTTPLIYTYQVLINFSPSFIKTALPANYNNTFSGVAKGASIPIYINYAGSDSAKGIIKIHYTDTIDAWGTVQLLTGNFNTLRQKSTETDIDSLFLFSKITHTWWFYQAQTFQYYYYTWYANYVHYPLVQMQTDSTFSVAKSVTWCTTPAGINAVNDAGAIQVYPNPAHNVLDLKLNGLGKTSYTLMSVDGRILKEETIEPGGNETVLIPVSEYAPGIYLLKVTSGTANFTKRIVIQ